MNNSPSAPPGATRFRLAGLLTLALAAATAPAGATETHACPALAAAIQVAACPTDEQLRMSYIGYCSDNRRIYAGAVQECARFEDYRRLKNVALWEAGKEFAFQGYLSCEVPPERIAAAAPRQVAVSRQGTVTRVACHYDEGLVMTLRTKASCAAPDAARCADDPAACRVRCD